MGYNNSYAKIGWSSADFMFSFGTTTIEDVQAVSWNDKQDMATIYGTGSNPIGYGLGKNESEASITLLTESVLALLKASPNGRLQSIPVFNLTILLLPEGSTAPITITLQNCKFKENKFSMKQGDMMVEQELPLLCSGVKVS